MSLVMLMTVAPLSAFAENGVIDTSEAIDQVLSGDEIISDIEPAAVGNVATLTAADVPEFIAMSDLTMRGTIRRVYEEEADLSTILFENNDGTRTLYMYGVPVKYVAPDGATRDKSTAISSLSGLQALWNGSTLTPGQMTTLAQNASIGRLELGQAAEALSLMNTRLMTAYGSTLRLTDMAYASLDSDIRSLYPTAVSDGVVLNYGDYSIRTIPVATGSLVLPGAANVAESSSLTDNDVRTRVRYSNAFGLGTILQYTPTTMGVKEEIILTSNVGKNSFSFRIETGGLTIEEENGNYFFFDPATQRVIAQLGEIIAYDSNGQIARGVVTVQSVIAGQRYNVTISVSPEFLANAAYPVSVDPTITIRDETTICIQDIGIYNGADAWNYTFEYAPYIGDSTLSDHNGAMLYRFPFIYGGGTVSFTEILSNAAQIGDATLHLCVTGGAGYPVTLRTKASTVSWSDDGMRICDAAAYSTAMGGSNSFESTVSVASTGAIAIDITDIMRSWYNYENNLNVGTVVDPEKGVLLYADDTSDRVDVGTIESSATNHIPYLTVEYITAAQTGPYYINNKGNQKFLTCTTSMTPYMEQGTVADLGQSMEWKLYYMGDGKYALSPVMYNGALFMNYLGEFSASPMDPADHSMWTMITDDTDYVFRNVSFTTRVLSYEYDVNYDILSVSWATLATTVNNINNSAITNDCKWRLVRKDQYMEFTIPSTAKIGVSPNETENIYQHFNIYSYSLTSSVDTFIFTNNETVAAIDADGNITPLQPGGTLTLTFWHYPTDTYFPITVYIGLLTDGTYFINNKSSNRYLLAGADVDNSTIFNPDSSEFVIDGTNVVGFPYINHFCAKWKLQLCNDGYYTIAVVDETDAHYYMRVVYNNGVYAVIAEEDIPNNSNTLNKWKIVTTSSGAYQLIPKSYESDGVVLKNSGSLNVTLGQYIHDTSYVDEWNFFEKVISYVNYYDSSIASNTTMIQNITTANIFADFVFSRYFNIGMHMDGSATQCETVIENCSVGENSPCEDSLCGSNCGVSHHKNGYVISNQFYNASREDDHLYVLWTNRSYGTYCNENAEVHETVNWIAVVYNKRPVIHFMTINGDSNVQLACMTLNLIHETAHTLKMDDVYDNVGHDISGATVCVMERFDPSNAYAFYQDVLNGVTQPFCSTCNESMKIHTSNISINGN